MEIASTIIPIFLVVAIGALAKRLGAFKSEFVESANRLVYYAAIPALVFRSIARTPFSTQFDSLLIGLTLAAVVLTPCLAFMAGRVTGVPPSECGTFLESAIHSNLGYIGLAVSYYFLGDTGLSRAGIVAGFYMIFQNFIAVAVLQFFGPRQDGGPLVSSIVPKILGHPVIASAIAGIAYSMTGWPLPVIADRSLKILSGLALPLALLIIGSSLSFGRMRKKLKTVVLADTMKLIVLPAIGLGLFRWAGIAPEGYLPALILLASPAATVVYVLSSEMGGDTDLAVATISSSTLLSAGTFFLWLTVAT